MYVIINQWFLSVSVQQTPMHFWCAFLQPMVAWPSEVAGIWGNVGLEKIKFIWGHMDIWALADNTSIHLQPISNIIYSLHSAALPDKHMGVMVPYCVIPSGSPAGMKFWINIKMNTKYNEHFYALNFSEIQPSWHMYSDIYYQ